MLNIRKRGARKLKCIWVLLIAAVLTLGLSGCNSSYKNILNMSNECQYILKILNCDYEILSIKTKPQKIIQRFNDLAEQGKTDGFYPLIIIVSDTLVDTLYYEMKDIDVENAAESIAAYRKSIIDSANEIDAKEFLSAQFIETDDFFGEFIQAEPDNDLSLKIYAFDLNSAVIIAKIPTANPWELAAWIPMGGFNECPTPDEQVAVFHYWYDKYGAVPAVVSHDTWQMTLSKPPFTSEEAEELAKEQFIFCSDIVLQGADTIRGLASTLIDSTTWFFWWD